MAKYDKQGVLNWLDENGYKYDKIEHAPVFTMEEMEKEQANENLSDDLKHSSDRLKKFFIIAMLVLFAIIAIILVNLIGKENAKLREERKESLYDPDSIEVKPVSDYRVYKFISDYFKARTNLNYVKIVM